MKVADIKCFCDGTDTGSFLKEGDYSSVLSSLDLLPSDLEAQETSLNEEMSGGGLDASALNLGGFSPLFEMGYTANKHIDSANNSIKEIKEIIESDAKTHMTNEWGKYYQEVFKHTEEKKQARDDALKYYNGLSDNDSNKKNAETAYLSAEADYQEHQTELSNASSQLEKCGGKGVLSSVMDTDFVNNATPAILNTHIGTGYNSDGSAAEETQASIYQELSNLGYSRAGICAILANMQQESAFDLTAVGDGGTSFGLCQWHDGRWSKLNSFCEQNGLDPNTVKGQVAFLDYELKNDYPDLYNQLQSADDSQATAESLARTWCIDFERPENAEQRANERAGNVANYWNKSEGVVTGASVISGYSNLSSMNDANNRQPKAVKERDYDTTVSTGQSATAQTVSSQIAQYAVNNCPGTYGWCAGAVETAVSAVTGIDIYGNAEDLLTNGELERAGYVRLNIDPASSDYVPVPGDVVICDEGYRSLDGSYGGYSEYGHAQIYTENGWYSDHAQPDGLGLYSNENAVFRYQGK